jgi:cytochrome c oxidase assembly protein subunit 15
MAAYALWFFAMVHAIDVRRTLGGGEAFGRALMLVSLVTLQAALGILTLINQVPLMLGLTHQAVAVAVLAMAVVHAERLIAPFKKI